MNRDLIDIIKTTTGASEVLRPQKIQDLWSGYGVIARYPLKGADTASVIVKHVRLPEGSSHPRGWNTGLSHERKLKSYKIEMNWYRTYSGFCGEKCRVPAFLNGQNHDGEFFMILEDLDAAGFEVRHRSLSPKDMRLCLKWLAHFHATFMNTKPADLWETGTYWHLETRPDELKALKDSDLRSAAPLIDEKLKASPFQTLVHGDAKLANFCFSADGDKVAAVDFQYVGGGCGMKDVAYFIGSCLYEEDCEKYETELLDYYFSVLVNVLKSRKSEIDTKALVEDWRALYPMAWTDFHRFIKGWSPGHWKIHSYSERVSKEVLKKLWS